MSKEHEAMLWESLGEHRVRCHLCGHECTIAEGKYGICRVRQNVGGELKTLNYESVVALNVDPVEKKPLFHFLPGTQTLSLAAPGCNFQCEFCQNWQISQSPREGKIAGQAVSPEQIVTAAQNYDCPSISFTYTEPTIFFELAYDTAVLAHNQGLRTIFVSNGYMSEAAIEKIAPYLDAINVDLKAFSDETYQKVMKAHLAPVLTACRALVKAGVWVEITTLVVPGMNDSPQELEHIADFIADELGPAVPWHVSRFHADYKMTDTQSTPLATLELACNLGREAGLKYIYSGNVPGIFDERTHCPRCGEVVIDRVGFSVRGISLRQGHCPKCNERIEGVWQ